MLLSPLYLERDGALASGQLIWNFQGDKNYIHFDLESYLQSNALMTILYRGWDNYLAKQGWSFPQTPYIRGSGFYNINDPEDYLIHTHVQGAKVNWDEAKATEVEAMLKFTWEDTTGQGTAKKVEQDDWTYEDCAFSDLVDTTETLRADVKAGRAWIEDVIVTDVAGKITATKKLIKLRELTSREAQVQVGEYEKLILKDISCPLLFIEPDKVRTEEGKAASLRYIFTKPQKELGHAKNLRGKLNWVNERIFIEGSAEEGTYLPEPSTVKNATFKVNIDEEDVLSTEVKLAELTIEEAGATLFNVYFKTKTEAVETVGSFDIEKLTLETAMGQGLSGKFRYEGEAYHITELRCSELELEPFKLRDLRGEAIYAYEAATIKLTNGQMTMSTKPPDGDPESENEDIEIQNISGLLYYRDDVLDVRDFLGTLHDGTLFGQVRYNLNNDTGKLALNLENGDLGKFLDQEDLKEKDKIYGNVSGRILVDFLNRDEMLLNGHGTAFVTESNLWRVPVVSEFLGFARKVPLVGWLIPKISLNNISEIQGNLGFKGDRIYLTKALSNGTVIKVECSGCYWWRTEGLDIRARTKLPYLGGTLTRRLVGTLDDYKWEKAAFLWDLFRTKELEDPAIKMLAKKRAKLKNKRKEPTRTKN